MSTNLRPLVSKLRPRRSEERTCLVALNEAWSEIEGLLTRAPEGQYPDAQELYDILSAAADEGVSYGMYGDRILMTDTNLNANAVILCYQVTENATRQIPVRADDGTLTYTNYSGNVYHYTAYNMGMWLGNAFIMAPWHLTGIEAAESEGYAEFVIPDLRENVSYSAEGDIEEWAEFYRFNGYTTEINGNILAVTDPDPGTLSAAVYGERNLTRPDKIEFTVTFGRGSVVFCGG